MKTKKQDLIVTLKSSPKGDKGKAKRARYWAKHEKPVKKLHNLPGMLRRLQKENILTTVVAVGTLSDNAVLSLTRKEDAVRNLALTIIQQKLNGALIRLKKQNPFMLRLPAKVEMARFASAGKAIEEAGKRARVA